MVAGSVASYAAARDALAISRSTPRSALSPYAIGKTRTEVSVCSPPRSAISWSRLLSGGYSFFPSVSSTTALIRLRSKDFSTCCDGRPGGRVERGAAVRHAAAAPSPGRSGSTERTGAVGTSSVHGVAPSDGGVEKVHSPSSSSGASLPTAPSAAFLARSSLVPPPLGTAPLIEPDTSITISTRARLRSAVHDF